MNPQNLADWSRITQESIAGAQKASREMLDDASAKRSITIGSSNFQGYNLQGPVKQLVALDSPFHASIPRFTKPGANSDHWRTITSISSPDPFVGAGAAGPTFSYTFAGSAEDGASGPSSVAAKFVPFALQGKVDLESQWAGVGYDDPLAHETATSLLLSLKLEGQAFLGASLTALGAPAGVAATQATTAGAVTTATYFVYVFALTLMAANRAKIDYPANVNANSESIMAGVAHTQAEVRAIALANTIVSGGGAGISPPSTVTNTGALTGPVAVKVKWTPTKGASAYLVFVGTSTGLANCKLEAIVTQAQVTFTSFAGTGVAANDAALPSTDETDNPNAYDGIINQCAVASGSGSYIKAISAVLAGTSSSGEVPDLQDAFQSLYNNAKIGKFRVVCSAQESRKLTALGVITGAMQIFAVPSGDGRTSFSIGGHAGEIQNAITGDRCPIEVEPWLPGGIMLILPTEIPYPMANESVPFKWVGSYDWMRWDYASTTSTGPVYPFDIRNNGVLEAIFTGGCGILYDIWKG